MQPPSGTLITKTRIAPTPSGFLHLGNAFSFALTAALAARYNARIALRIDDLDRQRVRPAYVQDIFDTLDFLEIPWHEGPRNPQDFENAYSQRHRLDLYRNALEALEDAVFACACSRATARNGDNETYTGHCIGQALPLNTPETKWRLHAAAGTPLAVRTPGGIFEAFLPVQQHHFVVRRKDGLPAYQLASLIDDQYFGIDLIVRGSDLWPSTLAQHFLARLLGLQCFIDSTFHHHALLTEPAGGKLSKSEGATSIQHLRKMGKTRTDVYRLIAGHAGLGGEINDWKALGDAVVGRKAGGEASLKTSSKTG